jgi:acetyl-CoA carboxylase carboxyl transferase subunit beta
MSAWEIVEAARAASRPSTRAYLQRISPGYVELHGDREGSDDPAVVAAVGRIGGIPVALTGFDRFAASALGGADGRPMPGGFRKAQRLLDLAGRWRLPVVSFVDTPGAYPGIEAEESGLAGEIARTLERMSSVATPTIAVVVGEGGSGGALALALADKVLIQRGAFFSVIGPEGAATILYRNASRASELAESLRITAPELLSLGIVDEIVPEPAGGAAADVDEAVRLLERAIVQQLAPLRKRRIGRLLQARRTRYRTIGMAYIGGQPPVLENAAEPNDEKSLTA